MKKRKETDSFDHESTNAMINEIEYHLDDEAFFEQFQPKNKRSKTSSKDKRDARRQIEEYWDNRKLAERLDEYYYHTDD